MPNHHLREIMQRLARLVLKLGVVLEKGQRVLVSANMAQRAFVHILAEEAYALGASYVEVDWQDEKLTQIRLKQAQGHFHYVPESKIAARR